MIYQMNGHLEHLYGNDVAEIGFEFEQEGPELRDASKPLIGCIHMHEFEQEETIPFSIDGEGFQIPNVPAGSFDSWEDIMDYISRECVEFWVGP